jgi:hypothetical protein
VPTCPEPRCLGRSSVVYHQAVLGSNRAPFFNQKAFFILSLFCWLDACPSLIPRTPPLLRFYEAKLKLTTVLSPPLLSNERNLKNSWTCPSRPLLYFSHYALRNSNYLKYLFSNLIYLFFVLYFNLLTTIFKKDLWSRVMSY